MITTFCTDLDVTNAESASLVEFGRVFASAKHAIFKAVHVLGQDENEARIRAQTQFGITYRIANSALYDARQAAEAWAGQVEWRCVQLTERIGVFTKDLAKLTDREDVRQRKRAHWLRRDLGKAEATLARLRADAEAGVPRVCFGGRALLRAGSVEAWRFRRVSNILLIGKAQDKSGNGMATYDPVRCELRIRLPDAVGGPGKDRWLTVRNVRFRYGQDAIASAIARKRPLTWRIFHEDGGWKAHVSVTPTPAEVLTRERRGMIGVDLNVDHVAVTVTTPDGNIRRVLTLPFPPHGTRKNVSRQVISDTVHAITALARHLCLPVAMEDLDFQRKKTGLRKVSIEHRKRLSSFAYEQFSDTLTRRCEAVGVRLVKVNPAHTSVLGREKYMRGRNLSVHHAAALVIARAAQGFTERRAIMLGGRGEVSVRTTRPGPAPAQPRVRVVRSGSRKARKPALRRERLMPGVTTRPSEERGRHPPAAGIGERSGVGSSRDGVKRRPARLDGNVRDLWRGQM